MEKEEVVTEELGLVQYYIFHKRKIHSCIAVLLGLAILLITYLNSGASTEEVSQAKKAFEKWKKTPTDQILKEEMLRSLKPIAGLERAKESEIAQILISAKEAESTELFARQSIERLRRESPFHASYAETTLLIERKEFQKALESSVALKAQMEKEGELAALRGKSLRGGSTLYACNLLRIALLQKQVGNAPGELSAWEELKGLLALQEDSAAAQLLEANFKRTGGNFSLSNFISERERALVR